ncbi:MAG: GntR family transcriptional regulator [Anaerolineae bacterium]|jgi:DNA-binding GntR family transcriptional regulator|nr:GntR family transcriptional regulator [Anaerolineae bacterium]MBT7189202.1 GntR family transcriptional regulator [Anaerolineae bacterium]MBT7991133.1 GntR family transcriptional regulator [Anaerolineae bacterium]
MKITDAEKAYRQIKEQIVTTKLRPGALISEADMMSELALGRTPIREAMKQLEADNLVSITPRRGMFVTDITVTDLTQIFEVRVEIEPLAVRLAVQRISKKELAQLRYLAEEYKDADPTDTEALLKLDSDFHALLAEAAHNKFLLKDLMQYYNLSLRIWYLALNYAQPNDIDMEAHLEILEAIEAMDVEKAEKRMRKHIQKFHQTIKQYL